MRPRARVAAVALVLAMTPATAAAAPTLQAGSTGPAVRAVQRALARTSYLPPTYVNGRFDQRTWHAVVAFQGVNALARDGIVGPLTRGALERARRPRAWSRREGLEVHVTEQVLLMVRDGRVRRTIHVSTGAAGRTPLGRFRIIRRERMSWSRTFRVWMPFAQYFYGGYALHSYPSVPAYPASHGCVRVPPEEIRGVWRFGRMGMRVWVAAGAAASEGVSLGARSRSCGG